MKKDFSNKNTFYAFRDKSHLEGPRLGMIVVTSQDRDDKNHGRTLTWVDIKWTRRVPGVIWVIGH